MNDGRLAWLTLPALPVAMLVIAVVALWAPRQVFRDAPTEMRPGACEHWGTRPCATEAARRLKGQARARFDFPIGWAQVVEARLAGPTPDHVEGTVVFRAPLGLPVARIRLYGQSGRYDYQLANWPLAWGAFLLAEGALGVLFCRRLWRALGLESAL
jgi:hypothetical protein